MQCLNQNKLQDYLNEKLSTSDMDKMERHIEQCLVCQKKLDELIDNPLEISAEAPTIDDAVLVSKIKARRKGIQRITIYGILGFLLGVFSRFYTADKFIITKAIMALPYKLAEFALGIFFSGDDLSPWFLNHPRAGIGFFPYAPILDIIAELITPAIISTFIAVTIGHLVSDKRIFRRKHIIRFIAAGILVISLWFGGIHVVYSHVLDQINKMEGIKSVTIYEKEKMSTSWLLRIDQNNIGKERYMQLLSDISKAKKVDKVLNLNYETGYEFQLEFTGGGQMLAHLDKDKGVFIMQNRNQYRLSKDSIEIIDEIARREKQ